MHPTKYDNVTFAWNIKIYEVEAALIVDQEVEIDDHLGTKAYPSGKEMIHEH